MPTEKDHEPDLAQPDVELAGHVATPAPVRMIKWGLLFVALVIFVMRMPFSNLGLSRLFRGSHNHVVPPVVNSRLNHQGESHWEEVRQSVCMAMLQSHPEMFVPTQVPVSDPSDLTWTKCLENKLCARMAVCSEHVHRSL